MTGLDEPSARLPAARGTGHLLLCGALGLLVAAAAMLTLAADDARLLRLGVLAALGAALLGAFAAAKMRRASTSGARRTEDLHAIHRLELERDIAARREHELALERELRREMQEDSRDELEAVRAELRSLRENLQKLFGGELLVERVALRAESTRVRSLPEEAANLSSSWLHSLQPVADPVAPPAEKDDAGSTVPGQELTVPGQESTEPALESPSARRSIPAPEESPPLPRRDPELRADPTRRPRPEAEQSTPCSTGLAGSSLFEESPQRSNPSWTSAWPSAPRPWDPGVPADPQPAPARDQWVPPAPPGPGTMPAESIRNRSESDPPTVPTAVGHRHHGEVAEESTGAHSDGRSVADLLAAYRADSGTRRRRRREDA